MPKPDHLQLHHFPCFGREQQTVVFGTAEQSLATRTACVGEGGQMWVGLTNILTQNLGFILAVKNEICKLSHSKHNLH